MKTQKIAGVCVRAKIFSKIRTQIKARRVYRDLAKNGWTQKNLWGGEGGI